MVLQIICSRRDHKTGKNMAMLVGGECVILHQKQRDNQDRGESNTKRIGYQGFKSSRFYLFFHMASNR
jgi:hypothetical protein